MSGSSPDSEREAELVRRARAGDSEALAALLRLWQPSLEAIARALQRRYGRMGFDTHDLVATSIRRLLRGGHAGLQDDADAGLLHHILRDSFTEKVRGELRRRRRETASVQAQDRRDASPAPIDLPRSMSPEEWELVLLWKQGLSWTQIAEQLAVPLETARKRWHRLMRRLRERGDPTRDEGASESESATGDAPGADPPSDRAADPGPPSDPPASGPPAHPG